MPCVTEAFSIVFVLPLRVTLGPLKLQVHKPIVRPPAC